MKYVFTGGAYREFRGHVFANGKPVTIMDAGTLEAVKLDPTFKEYHDEKEAEAAPAKEVLTPAPQPKRDIAGIRRSILHARGR